MSTYALFCVKNKLLNKNTTKYNDNKHNTCSGKYFVSKWAFSKKSNTTKQKQNRIKAKQTTKTNKQKQTTTNKTRGFWDQLVDLFYLCFKLDKNYLWQQEETWTSEKAAVNLLNLCSVKTISTYPWTNISYSQQLIKLS